MELKCGTDIVEIERIKDSIEKLGDKFKNKIYTEMEIEYCESKLKQKYQHYAARFAAKEAVFKAVSEHLDNKYSVEWKDIEVINDEYGRPSINLKNEDINKQIKSTDISISHCRSYAVANVIVIF